MPPILDSSKPQWSIYHYLRHYSWWVSSQAQIQCISYHTPLKAHVSWMHHSESMISINLPVRQECSVIPFLCSDFHYLSTRQICQPLTKPPLLEGHQPPLHISARAYLYAKMLVLKNVRVKCGAAEGWLVSWVWDSLNDT